MIIWHRLKWLELHLTFTAICSPYPVNLITSNNSTNFIKSSQDNSESPKILSTTLIDNYKLAALGCAVFFATRNCHFLCHCNCNCDYDCHCDCHCHLNSDKIVAICGARVVSQHRASGTCLQREREHSTWGFTLQKKTPEGLHFRKNTWELSLSEKEPDSGL